MIADAKATLEGYPDGHFDVIVLDLCDPLDYGPCYTLYSAEFYETCHKKLSEEGACVFVMCVMCVMCVCVRTGVGVRADVWVGGLVWVWACVCVCMCA